MSIFASKIEINSGQQFVFSITYQDENVTVDEKMSSSVDGKMSKGNVQGWNKMSMDETENVLGEMSKAAPRRQPTKTQPKAAPQLKAATAGPFLFSRSGHLFALCRVAVS